MELKNKKWLYIGAGVLGLGALAYYQYKKLMDFTLGFKSARVNSVGVNGINLDLFFNFTNKSAVKVEVLSQSYDVYINDIYVTTLSNSLANTIQPKATSVVGVNVNLTKSDLASLGQRLKGGLLSLLNVANIKVTIKEHIKMKVAGFIPYTLNYNYNTTIKEMTAPSSKN
jgi:LEA14-like dessication related protein